MADLYSEIPELSAEQAGILRRRKIADLIRERSMKPLESQTAGGYVVPTNPLLALGKLGEAYLGRDIERGADTQQAELGEKASGMQSAERQKIIDALTPKPETQFTPDMMPGESNPFGKLIESSARNQTPEDQLQSLIGARGEAQFGNTQKWADLQQKYLEGKISREDMQQAKLDAAKIAAQARIDAKNDSKDQKPFLVTDNAGNSKLVDMKGNLIKDLGTVSKPTATFEKTVETKKKLGKDLDAAIKELEKATKDGGLIDQSTGSGAGALVDIGAGFIGQSTKGAIAVGELKPIYDLVLKMVPRFEGPQSDRDTASYEKAAGQLANPAVPNDIKKAAGREILRLMKERKNQFFDKTSDTPVNVDQPATSDKTRTIVRTGTQNGKKVIQYSDGSIEYGN